MKYFLLFLIIIPFFACSVNESTSLWTITNKSDITVTNIKLGDTLILSSLSSGAKYDYYFTANLFGKLSSAEALSAGYATDYDVNKNTIIRRKGDYNLKAGNYYFYSDIFKKDGEYYITLRCEPKEEHLEDESDEYAQGGYYED